MNNTFAHFERWTILQVEPLAIEANNEGACDYVEVRLIADEIVERFNEH